MSHKMLAERCLRYSNDTFDLSDQLYPMSNETLRLVFSINDMPENGRLCSSAIETFNLLSQFVKVRYQLSVNRNNGIRTVVDANGNPEAVDVDVRSVYVDIHRKKYDLFIGNIVYSLLLHERFECITPDTVISMLQFMYIPKALDTTTAFFEIFDAMTWAGFLCSLLVMATVLTLVGNLSKDQTCSPEEMGVTRRGHRIAFFSTFRRTLWSLLCCIVLFRNNRKKVFSSLVIYGIWSLSLLPVMYVFTSFIYTSLVVNDEVLYNSLQDLKAHPEVKIFAENSTLQQFYIAYLLKGSGLKVELYDDLTPTLMKSTARKDFMAGDAVLVFDTFDAQTIKQLIYFLSLKLSKEAYYASLVTSSCFRPGLSASFKNRIKTAMFAIRESGLRSVLDDNYSYWRRSFARRRPDVKDHHAKDKSPLSAVSLRHHYFTFRLCFCCLLGATAVLALEVLHNWHRKKRAALRRGLSVEMGLVY